MNKYTAKRRIAAAMAVIMILSATGCGKSDTDSKSGKEESSEQYSVPDITLPPKEESSAESLSGDQSSETPQDIEPDTDGEQQPYTPAMWKLTSPNGGTMYMMGSMHALKAECYPLPDYVQSAYDQSDVLAVECDITNTMDSVAATLKYTDKLTYLQGDSAANHMDADEWADICSYLELHGEQPENYQLYQLWYLSQLLESFVIADAELDTMQGIDLMLLNDAHKSGKEIYEIESVEAQMDLLANLSEETYAVTLKGYSAENSEEICQEMTDMYNCWRTGDVDGIAESETETDMQEYTEEEQEIIADYNKQLLTDRNVGMAEAAKKLVDQEKTVFYIVGAAHFVGDDGIIALLEKDGYKAERING